MRVSNAASMKSVDEVPIDKMGLRHYFVNYEKYIGPLRMQPLRLLELGIAHGDSLRHWESWLPNAKITGLDIKPCEARFESGRVRCYVGEQRLAFDGTGIDQVEFLLSANPGEPLRPLAPALATVALIVIPLLYIGYGRSVLHMPTQGPVFEQIARVLDIQPNAQNGFYDSAGRITGAYADIGHLTTRADIDAGNLIVDMIRALPEGVPVLSEEAAFPLAAGRDVVTNPVVLMILSWVGVFEGQELIAMIEERAFGLVILRAQFYPAGVLEAIGDHYEHQQEIRMNGFDYIILEPRQRTVPSD